MASCKKSNQQPIDNVASFRNYVQSYGPLSLSKQDEIYIDLKAQGFPEIDDSEIQKFFSIKPALKANYYIKDKHIIVIDPIDGLASDTHYKVSFDIKKFLNLPELENEKLEFETAVRPQFAKLVFMDYFYDKDKWVLDVKLQLNDKESLDNLRKFTEVKSKGEKLDFNIIMNDPQQPVIRIYDVNTQNTNDEINVSFDAQKIGAKKSTDYAFNIPQQKTLELLETKENVNNKSISFIFNKPLSTNQNLDGFITVQNVKKPKYLITTNSLVVFYNQSVEEQTITVGKGIKAQDGDKLKSELDFLIGQSVINPNVYNVGLGHIIPTVDEIIYPFEAIGLKKVRIEIFQIHSDNLRQFYQRNTLQSAYQLEYLGEVVHEEVLDLSSLSSAFDPFEKKRYYFNFANFAKNDPNSVYEIRIGFLPEDVLMECASSLEEPPEGSIFRSSYRGIYGYYTDFNWNDRDDPCKKAYYNNDKFISKLVVNTNIGIIAKKSNNGDLIVFANDINTTEALSGAEVNIYNKAQRELINTKTDKDGMVFLKDMEQAYLIEVKKGIRENWLNIKNNDGLSLSKFKVDGRVTKNGLDGFIYAERNIWRPGDTMFVDFIVHDPEDKLPSNHPVEITLKNPKDKKVFEYINTNNKGPFYSFAIPTSTSFLTGDYYIEAKLGTNYFGKYVKIETIKPNKFSIRNNATDIASFSEKLRNGNTNLEYEIMWLYGAPAKNKKLKVEMDVYKKRFIADGYNDYTFSDPRNKYNAPPTIMLADVSTNDEGNANVPLTTTKELNQPGLVNLVFKATAYESSGDFSTGVSKVEYSPYSHYTGMEVPKNQYNYKRVNKDQESTINLVSLDEHKKPSSNRDIKVNVYRMEHYWWYDSYNDKFDLANSSVHVSANEFEVKTDRSGKGAINLSFHTYGRYYIKACDEESGHCTGDYLYVGYPWNTEGMNRAVYEDAAQLNFESTESSYSTGETVELNVPSYFQGKALISLENGSTVVESFWTKVKRGNNKIKFTAQPDMFPTIYAHVTLLQAHEDKTTDMPIRSYGVLPINIEDDRLKLNPEIIVKDELKPKEQYEVKVKEKDGKEMYYTIAVVDEGLLNITNFKTPDPMSHFYSKPALGVRTFDMYNDVMSYYGKDINQLFSIGGDGVILDGESEKKANRFKSVVTHIGPFHLRAGAQNKHQLNLPNYIGNVRFMLVAANKEDYGSAEKNVPVKQDLMMLTTLPRTLAPGDEVDVPMTIFTMKDNMGEINYSLQAEGVKATLLQNNGRFTSVKDDEKLMNLKANIGTEEGILRFFSNAKSSKVNSSQEIEIQVENPNPIIRRSESFFLESGAKKTFDLEPIGDNDSEYSISVSSLAPVNTEELIDNLMRYPYGCLEQRTSAAYAALYHEVLGEDLLNKDYADQLVKDHLGILYRFKQSSGYSLWPGSRRYDGWLTSYVGDFLLDAKERGYGVNKGMIDEWVKDQSAIASNWNPANEKYRYSKEASVFAQAFRLYTLAKSQNPAIGEMNRLREDYTLDYNSGLLLAAAYAEVGRDDIAEKVYQSVSSSNKQTDYYYYSYGSYIRNSALRILLYHKLNKKNELAQEMKYMSDELEGKSYLSTHTATFVLRALAIINEDVGLSKEVSFNYVEDGKETNFSNQQAAVHLEGELLAKKTFSIQNIAQNGVYVQRTRRGKENLGNESISSKSIEVSTVFVDMENQVIDVKNLEKGTDFEMITTVSRNSDLGVNLKNIALRQAIPSGWEILNDRINDTGQNNSSEFDYQDIRDSKVHTFIDLSNKEQVHVRIKLKATYSGTYYQPKILAESMYSDQVYAEEAGFKCVVR